MTSRHEDLQEPMPIFDEGQKGFPLSETSDFRMEGHKGFEADPDTLFLI